MHRALARSFTAILLAGSFVSPLVVAQQPSIEATRPRRAKLDPPSTNTIPPRDIWNAPPTDAISLSESRAELPNGTEPLIRVALATNARSGNISTIGKLLNSTGAASSFLALSATRVRVEPRLLSPLPLDATDRFVIRIEGSASAAEARQKSGELSELLGDDSKVTADEQTGGKDLLVTTRSSRAEANALIERLTEAGFDASLVTLQKSSVDQLSKSKDEKDRGNLRLVSRLSTPSRAVVGIAPGSEELFNSSAPVTFAAEDERQTPVRFNDRPYRGRIEVFTNPRGLLTVVNVLGIEDYVRGVVANELSPGSYPAINALKAQAIAARTYALRNRGQFMSQGFDLLPTTRSQVYRGLASENPLSTRAVDETRGMVATYNGEPINALYTSTCGGRTENSENIFNNMVPYLRSRECAVEGQAALAQFDIRSNRDLPDLHAEKNVALSRTTALLALQNFSLARGKLTDSWLDAEASTGEIRSWLTTMAVLTRQSTPLVTEDGNRPGPFATALTNAIFGESRADTLLNSADVEYFLAIRDADEIPINNRADVASLVRDGYLSVYPDATLRPRLPLSRGRALQAIARVLEARSLLQLQKGTARPTAQGVLIIRGTRNKDLTIKVSANAFLFRQIGDALYPVRSVILVGGEPVIFHVGPAGEVDYLEVRPAPNGASAERSSPFTNWTTELSPGQVQARLGKWARGVGTLTDLRVVTRGASRRAIDIEVVGSQKNAHVRGGRIRSALGLREQLFVIDRKYDDQGRVSSFVFTGRGWGHGVGMCQVGAYGLAKQGLSYEQILKAYYTGIEVTRLY